MPRWDRQPAPSAHERVDAPADPFIVGATTQTERRVTVLGNSAARVTLDRDAVTFALDPLPSRLATNWIAGVHMVGLTGRRAASDGATLFGC